VKLLFDENLSPRLVELLAIVSKDNDFRQRAFLSGPPPKVIRLVVGNASTQQILELLQSKLAEARAFGESARESLLVLEL
jgi:predicted nuclease of predicted toxin-antitoxin system